MADYIIEELATVSRSSKEVNILKITGTSVAESQPEYTDYSSWAEKEKWSYNLLTDDIDTEKGRANTFKVVTLKVIVDLETRRLYLKFLRI